MPSEVLVIEAVSDKFKNKYSSGSIKANGKWMQVSSKIDLSAFRKDAEVSVETKTNDKGYTSVVGLVKPLTPDEQGLHSVPVAEKPKRAKKETTETVETAPKVTSYEDNKNRKILVQGITQACVQAPGLVSLSITNTNELAEATEQLALRLIQFVENNI